MQLPHHGIWLPPVGNRGLCAHSDNIVSIMEKPNTWPALPLDGWLQTYATLHMWTQIVGKITLALTPRMNHFWNVALQITPRGLATPMLTHGDRAFTMIFDFVDHRLLIQCSDGGTETISLEPR